MRKLIPFLVLFLSTMACTTQEIIPPTRTVIGETVATRTAVATSTATMVDLALSSPTPTLSPTPTIVTTLEPTPLPTPTALSVPVSELRNAEVQFNIVDQFGGQPFAIEVVDNKVYVGVGARLYVIDVQNSDSPQLIGQSEPFPALIWDIEVVNGQAFVALGQSGVRILDIRDPAAISVLSEFGFEGRYGIFSLAVDANRLYGAATTYGSDGTIHIYDVTDPSYPIHLTTEPWFITMVRTKSPPILVNGHLYATGGFRDNRKHELQIYSFDDPLSPQLEGSISVDGAYSFFTIVNHLLYFIGYNVGYQTLNVIDIADPGQPEIVGNLTIEDNLKPRGIAVRDGYVFVVGDQYTGTPCGFETRIYDVSDLSNLREVNRMSQAVCSPEFVTVGNQIYVAEPHQMRILDLSNPTELTEIGRYDIPLAPGKPTRIVTNNSNAYVFDAVNETLSVWDTSNPGTPSTIMSSIPLTGGSAFDIANDLMYVPGWVGHHNRFRVFSLTNPAQPELIMDELYGVYTAAGDPVDFIIAGTAIETVNAEGLPLSPAISRGVEDFFSYVVAETSQYVAVGSLKSIPYEEIEWRLEIYRITNSKALELVGTAPIPEMIRAIVAAGDKVYVIWGEDSNFGDQDAILGQLLVFDISDPTSPKIVRTLNLPRSITTATIKGDYIYFGVSYIYEDAISGIYAVNLNSPSYVAGFKQLAGGVHGITQVGDLLYVASGDGGVHTLQTQP